jgi:NitT/TauT family transport system permease protein
LKTSPPATPSKRARLVEALACALFAPIVGALVLALHLWLPNRPAVPSDTGLYVQLLQILLGMALVLALAQWASRRLRARTRDYALLLGGIFCWLFLWDVLTIKVSWLPQGFYPGPDQVFDGIVEDWAYILQNAYHSLVLLLTGYAGGVLLGLVSGVLMGWFRTVRFWGMPIMKLLGPLPATALVPTAMMLANRFASDSFYARALLITFAVWFPVTMLTTSGIRNVPTSYYDVARTLGAGRAFLIFRVAIPSALPTIFIGLFMGLVVSFLTFSVAETVGAQYGLGYYLEVQRTSFVYAKVYGALLIIAVFCSGLLTLLFLVRDWMLRWQKGVIRW